MYFIRSLSFSYCANRGFVHDVVTSTLTPQHLVEDGGRKEKIMSKTMKPGQSAPRSGQYGIFGPLGGDTGAERTVTRGEPLPPTLKPGMGYKLVDPTKHK